MRVAEQLPPALCRGVLGLQECERTRQATAAEHGPALAVRKPQALLQSPSQTVRRWLCQQARIAPLAG